MGQMYYKPKGGGPLVPIGPSIPGADGPPGPPGPTAVSSDAGNLAELGTDGKIYVPDDAGGSDEVWIAATAPVDPEIELWVDTDAVGRTQADLDTLYVNTTGDTMTGDLSLDKGSPTMLTLHTPANRLQFMSRDTDSKHYIIASDRTNVAKRPLVIQASDVSFPSGTVTLPADPASALQAATKQYVDNANSLKAPLASPALTGTPTAPTAAVNTSTTQIATTAYVNAEISNDAVLKTGGTMTGALIVAADPTAALGVATKQYVDKIGRQTDIWATVSTALSWAAGGWSAETVVTLGGILAADGVVTLAGNEFTMVEAGDYLFRYSTWRDSGTANVIARFTMQWLNGGTWTSIGESVLDNFVPSGFAGGGTGYTHGSVTLSGQPAGRKYRFVSQMGAAVAGSGAVSISRCQIVRTGH